MTKFINTFKALIMIAAILAVFTVTLDSQSISVGRRNARTAPGSSSSIDRTLLLKDLEYLSSDELEGRSAGRPSIAKTRDFVERRFRESGLESFRGTYRQEFTIQVRGQENGLRGVNFVGFIKGKKQPARYIVVTAHYDHDGIKDGQIYNGADDNASGTAALFAMASAFKKQRPDHSIIFVAFDAEEVGLQGSRYFVANLPVKNESIVVNVNMDMISRSDKDELYAAGLTRYSQFTNVIDTVKKRSRIKLLRGHDIPGTGKDDWTNQSDHAAFHAAKIPFIYFGVEDHADYHKPTDDFQRINPVFYASAVETVLAVIREIDKEKWGTAIGDGGPLTR